MRHATCCTRQCPFPASPLPPHHSAPPSLGSVGGLKLERTRDDFDDTVIPAAIIAALILLVGLLLLLNGWCRKRDGEEELLQRYVTQTVPSA
jgi:hypothetical protein